MSALRDTQVAWRAALLGGHEPSAFAGVAGDGLAPQARVAIYRHHVAASLTDLLESVYPVVCRLVDPRFFRYAADRFIAAHPPAGPCLFEYGEAVPEFLTRFEPCRALDWLPDVARLEWALHRACFADDATPLDPRALAALPPDALAGLRLRLHPSVTLLTSPFAVDAIWRANQPDTPVADVTDAGPVHLEVRRHGDDAVLRRLDAAAWRLRAALREGATLTEAAERAVSETTGFDLAAALHELFSDDVLVAFTYATRKETA
jgi:hypothetical protein